MATKKCTKCGKEQPLSAFGKNSSTKDGLHYRCRKCHRTAVKAWQAANPEKTRAAQIRWRAKNPAKVNKTSYRNRLRREHGMTEEDYNHRCEQQQGKCAICRQPPDDKQRLVVDHDHTTGAIRGILCNRCNRAIGLLGDTHKAVAAAAAYLDES